MDLSVCDCNRRICIGSQSLLYAVISIQPSLFMLLDDQRTSAGSTGSFPTRISVVHEASQGVEHGPNSVFCFGSDCPSGILYVVPVKAIGGWDRRTGGQESCNPSIIQTRRKPIRPLCIHTIEAIFGSRNQEMIEVSTRTKVHSQSLYK
jgi:hypothetical protein